MRPARILISVFSCFALLAAPVSASDPAQQGAKGGAGRDLLDPVVVSGPPSQQVTNNFEVVGHTTLGGGVPNGDVALYDHQSAGKFAYVGTWSAQCTGQGIKAIDVNDPAHPRWVGFIGAHKGSSNEDMDIVRIGNRDVIGIGVQACGRGGADGLALFDVTNPRAPITLGFLPTITGVHELDLVVRGDGTALALLAVPFAEFAGGEGEFQIANISDPTHPALIAKWRLYDQGLTMHDGSHTITSPYQGDGVAPIMFVHSVRAADGGLTAYVSHWDGGVVKVDISNLANLQTVGHTVYPPGSDGDAHSMTPYDTTAGRYILQNDEDFGPGYSMATVTSSVTATRQFNALQEPWAPTPLGTVGPVSGTVYDAGDGCQPSDYAGADGMIAVADTVDPYYNPAPCAVGDQALMAAQAGATVFLSNLLSIDDAYGFGPDTSADLSALAGIPVLQMSDIDGMADAIRAAAEPVTLSLTPVTPGWGFLRVFAETADRNWEEVGRYEGPAVNGTPDFPAGSWSIHNTEVAGDHAYSSWYSAGILAFDVSDPVNPQLVGQFVPKSTRRHANALGVGPAEVWGVAIDSGAGLIYASDMRTGLWIVRPTGPAAP